MKAADDPAAELLDRLPFGHLTLSLPKTHYRRLQTAVCCKKTGQALCWFHSAGMRLCRASAFRCVRCFAVFAGSTEAAGCAGPKTAQAGRVRRWILWRRTRGTDGAQPLVQGRRIPLAADETAATHRAFGVPRFEVLTDSNPDAAECPRTATIAWRQDLEDRNGRLAAQQDAAGLLPRVRRDGKMVEYRLGITRMSLQ
jgi:hypothetical protein